jgi:hypothetical protein
MKTKRSNPNKFHIMIRVIQELKTAGFNVDTRDTDSIVIEKPPITLEDLEVYDVCQIHNHAVIFAGINSRNHPIYEAITLTNSEFKAGVDVDETFIPDGYKPIQYNLYWGYEGLLPKTILEKRNGKRTTVKTLRKRYPNLY